MRLLKGIAVTLLMAAAAGASAQGGVPDVKTEGSVSYLSGGIGEGAQDELKAREKDFNLKLVFTLVEGNYLSDVDVAVSDAGGRKILEDVAEGPFFLAKMPPGKYRVTATYGGKSQTRQVQIGKGLRTEYMRWPSDPTADFPLPRDSAVGAGRNARERN